MTTLLERIRQDSLVARKARESDKALFLTTLLSEAGRVGKDDGNRESTDAEVTATVKKFIKNTEETLRVLPAGSSARVQPESELAILNAYLPRQASEDEVRAAIGRYVAELAERNPKQMGVVMGKLNAEFAGNFDKGIASKLVKEVLAG
jgi:uncharacterized protein YqeY